MALAEKQRLPVWAPPAAGGSRIGFPESHPNFVGALPPAIGPVAETLKEHDLVLVVGAAVFAYYPYIPGPLLGPDTALVAITADPAEAARAPMGDAIVGDVGLALERLVELVPAADAARRPGPSARPEPGDPPAADPPERLSGSQAMAALAAAWPPDGIVVLESPSATLSLRNRLRISQPGSYYAGASGGLGFGIAAAVGVQLAQPDRPVVCVLGEGSAQYGITALWSAVAYRTPVTFLVLRNDEYAILKWFALLEQVVGRPGARYPGARCRRRRARLRHGGQRGDRRRGAHREPARGDRRPRRTAPDPGPGGRGDVVGVSVAEPVPPPDAIVVGAGLAGLVATHELVKAGRRVLVLDQENRNNLGGQAFWSLGGLFFVDSPEQRRIGIKDSYELACQDWLGSAGFDREDEDHWPRQWAQAYVRFAATEKRDYLHELGLRVMPLVGWAERGDGRAVGHGNSVPRFHLTWGTGPEVVRVFLEPVLRASGAASCASRSAIRWTS